MVSNLHIMGDQQHGMAFLIERIQQGEDVLCGLGIEGAGGLVRQQDGRIVRQRPCDGYPLLLSAGQLMRLVMHARGKADPIEQLLCPGGSYGLLFAAEDERQHDILQRCQPGNELESLKHKAYIRFEKERCNEMWQTDFKGEFKMQNGNYCFPLDIFDDHSRFVIRIKPAETTANIVLPVFREAFLEYGKPDSVLSDNGAQFAGFRQGYTQFEKWLMNHDVLPIHGRIKHPQTQGKIERFHRAMNQELLKHYIPKDISDAERIFNEWRNCYNNERPHEALGMKCPSDVYVPSERAYQDQIDKYEYSGKYHVIKVNNWGYVRFDSWQIYLSETMIGEHIEFRPNSNGDTFIACYRNFAIAEFDVHTGKLLHRKIWRI